jgi:hypothetical protein
MRAWNWLLQRREREEEVNEEVQVHLRMAAEGLPDASLPIAFPGQRTWSIRSKTT